MLPLPLPFDPAYALKARPTLEKVRELLGGYAGPIEFVASIPCLYQGWEVDEWAYVIKDGSSIRYLLMSDHCRWYVADEQELRQLTTLYATASQVAVRALIELTEGMKQDEMQFRKNAAKSLNLTIGQEELEASPALSSAVSALVDAAEADAKKRGQSDGEA